MKLFIIIILFTSLQALAQNKSIDTIAKPAITETGKPIGNKEEMKLGKEGGRLSSSDGKIELVIPVGALAKNTIISIQAISNFAPNGTGTAYRLEPSGMVFPEPVQLIFHYGDKDDMFSVPELMGIATQDNSGQWYRLSNFILDTIARTIGGNINHFSDWTKFDKLKIDPGHARVKINKEKDLEIIGVDDKPVATEDFLVPLVQKKISWKTTWTANGIVNGNKVVGTIDPRSSTFAIFDAPVEVPDENPVEVAAQLNGLTFKYHGKTFNDLRLISHILVFDNAYEVLLKGHNDNLGVYGLTFSTYDSSSFVITLNGKKSKVTEIINYPFYAKFEARGKVCAWEWVNKNCYGPIQIAGVKDIKLFPPKSPGSTSGSVFITFIQIPSDIPKILYYCPQAFPIKPFPIPALPINLFFEDNGKEQVFSDGDSRNNSFIRIRPVMEE